jgi:hypothetical protein
MDKKRVLEEKINRCWRCFRHQTFLWRNPPPYTGGGLRRPGGRGGAAGWEEEGA